MTLTSLMEDLRLAEEQCTRSVIANDNPQHLNVTERVGKRKDGNEASSPEEKAKVLEGIRLVTRMVLLAADSIRKDAVNLPLIVSMRPY